MSQTDPPLQDHGLVMTRRGADYRALCTCGWVGDWRSSETAAEADHDMHVELTRDV